MGVKPGYKQTEVGVIPEDWEVVPLSDIASRIMVGIASAATHAYRNSGIIMFRNQNIKPGYLEDNDVLFIDENYEATFKNKRLKDGDILTARTGYPGTTCVVPKKHEGAQSFTTLITRPNNERVGSQYLCDYINSENGQLYFEQNQIGGGQKNVNAGSLKNLLVPLPPTLAEQEAIAAALSDADALIEALEQVIAKKSLVKQGAMQELLTGKRRLPGFRGEWETKRLDEIGHWTGGMTPSMQNPRYWNNPTTPWISSGDVKSVFLFSTAFSVSDLAIKQNMAPLIQALSIIVVMRSGILRKFFPVCMNMVPMSINQDIKAIIPLPTITSGYLLHTLIMNGEKILSQCLKSGTTVESIEFRWLKAFAISLPPLPEQSAIAAILSDMDAEIAALEDKLAKARRVKEGMMRELLTGRIRLV
ncbi:MAG: hypothetical protein A2001_11575 [Treponema sp. GWC1_61_84]|nr:MAG: hypothetical protein A2001_11575 [Treponema sp. GWC1_61_84]